MRLFAPMLVPLAGLVSGILMENIGVPLWFGIVLIISALGIYLFLIARSHNPIFAFRSNGLHYLWIYAAFSCVGLFSAFVVRPHIPEKPQDYIYAEGRIIDITQSTSGDQAIIDIKRFIDSSGNSVKAERCRILLKSDALQAQTDDEISLPVDMMEIEDSRNYFNTGYAEFLRRKGIFFQTFVEGEKIKKTGHTLSFIGLSHKIRNRIESFIENTHLDKSTQNFLITILVGDRDYLDRNTMNLYSDAGISHILALSGMHVAIISSIFLWLLFPFNLYGKYKLRYCLTVVALLLYAYITGLNPSTVRATLMMSALTCCIILERKNSAWNSLLFSTFVILLFSPSALFDIGLQLSFICVASLIFFVRPLNPFEQHEHKLFYNIATLIITILIATGATWCVSAYYFGRIPITFLPANLLILPFLPVYLIIAIFYFVLSSVGFESTILASILDKGQEILYNTVSLLTGDGDSAIQFSPSLWTVLIWMTIITLFAIMIHERKKICKWAIPVLTGCFIMSVTFTSEAEEYRGFIIQKGVQNVKILEKSGNSEKLHKIERKTICEYKVSDRKLLIIDGPMNSDKKIKEPLKYDEIVIAGGCHDDLGELFCKFKAEKIVVHPSVRKKRESQIKSSADSLGIEFYSIRESGPYKFMKRK